MLQYGGGGLKEADSGAFLYRAESPVPAVYGAGLGGGIVLVNAWRRRFARGQFGLGCGLALMNAVLLAAVNHQLGAISDQDWKVGPIPRFDSGF